MGEVSDMEPVVAADVARDDLPDVVPSDRWERAGQVVGFLFFAVAGIGLLGALVAVARGWL